VNTHVDLLLLLLLLLLLGLMGSMGPQRQALVLQAGSSRSC
jgi:hypothetical protein